LPKSKGDLVMPRTLVTLGCAALLGILATALCGQESGSPQTPKSVTVYPLTFTTEADVPPSLSVRVSEVLGLLLERAGVEKVETSETPFSPETAAGGDWSDAFGTFVAEQAIPTDFAVWGNLSGSPGKIQEVQIAVVRRDGTVVMAERLGAAEFRESRVKPDDLMAACVFLVSRLDQLWALEDPLRSDAPEGAMAELMAKRSGLPPKEEIAAAKSRFTKLVQSEGPATLTVYPVHLWPGSNAEAAQRLCQMINDNGRFEAQASDAQLNLQIQPDPNEQKVLWDTARAFRDYLRAHPADTQYALLADFGIAEQPVSAREAHHVHLILCQGDGQWVWVDYQNSHHADFQAVSPKSLEACNRLAQQRLRSQLGD
jgi:hypothetical protein